MRGAVVTTGGVSFLTSENYNSPGQMTAPILDAVPKLYAPFQDCERTRTMKAFQCNGHAHGSLSDLKETGNREQHGLKSRRSSVVVVVG